MSRLLLLAVGFVSALLIVATATEPQRSTAIIEPNDRVHGMLVVQGTGAQAELALFGTLCPTGHRQERTLQAYLSGRPPRRLAAVRRLRLVRFRPRVSRRPGARPNGDGGSMASASG